MDGLNPRHSFFIALALLACATLARAQVAHLQRLPSSVAARHSRFNRGRSERAALFHRRPDHDEQYYLELINRARANSDSGRDPARHHDGTRTVLGAYASFGVNLILMRAQFALIRAAPALR